MTAVLAGGLAVVALPSTAYAATAATGLTTLKRAVVLPPSGPEPFSIGNRVFVDDGADGAGGFNAAQRDNGLQDAGESGVDGVRVELYYDADSNGQATPDELIRYDVTAAGAAGPGRPGASADGYYLFDDLPQGTYLVKVPASEFAPGRPLGGHHSSTFNGTATVGAPGAAGIPATDLDDNGRDPASRRPDIDGVTSNAITFADGQTVVTGETDLSLEPDPGGAANQVGTNDPTGWDGPGSIGRRTTGSQRDDASDVAVDLGFTPPMSIGNRIWLDDGSDPAQWGPGGSRNNALIDGTDDGNLVAAGLQNPGIANVVVNLFYDENTNGQVDGADRLVATTTTNATGYYLFDGLAAGTYLVRLPSTDFAPGQPLNGLISAFDVVTQVSPTNQTDTNDNGIDDAAPGTNGITTRQVQLVALSEATGETDPNPQTQAARGRFGETDADSDLTVDLGFVRPPMAVGNRVWVDDHPTTQSLRNNAVRDAGESAVAGAEVALYRDLNLNGVVDAGEDTGLRDTTDSAAAYGFDNLPPGGYLVAVTAANFNAGSPLDNRISSRSVAPNPVAGDTQVDNTDHGRDTFVAGVGIVSTTIVLVYGTESTTEASAGPYGTHGERNSDSDTTVDFGFYTPMSLGNRVWLDDSTNPANAGTSDNAQLDPSADDLDNPNIGGVQGLGVAGVTMRLYRDLDADGTVDPGEDTGRTTTTNASGRYVFDGLTRGSYVVGVQPSNFTGTAPLVGFRSSTNATGPTDDDVDSRDKGVGRTPSPTLGLISPSILLSWNNQVTGAEPTNESDPTPQTQADRGANGERNDFSNLTVDFGFVRANTAPTAVGDSYATAFGTTLTVAAPGVLGNDTDPEGDPLTAVLVTGPAHGTLSLGANGLFTYTPTTGYAGPDSFTYRAADASLASAPATVSLTVAANQAPTADDGTYTTPFETPLTVAAPGVLGNDADPEGKPLTAVLLSGPAQGSLALDANGSFTYTPPTGATGPVTFTYRADDGYASSGPATVTITIGADPNQAPTAAGDSYSTPHQTPVAVAAPGVLGNDSDAEGDPLTVQLVTGPVHGTLSLAADGSFTYTPTGAFSGQDSFTYRAHDGKLFSAPATVTITVLPDVTPPTVTFDAPAGPVNAAFGVSVLFSEPVTGLSEADFVVTGATIGLTGSGASYQLVVTPTSSGTLTVRLPADSAVDAGGNGNTASATLTRTADIDRPSVLLSAPAGPLNGAFTVTATFSEAISGFNATDPGDVVITNATVIGLSGPAGPGDPPVYGFRLQPLGDGPVTVTVRDGAATDAVGNPSTASTTLTRLYDGTRPDVGLSAPAGPVGVAFTVTATFSEPVTGFDLADVTVGNGTASDLAGSGTTYTFTVAPAASGPVTVDVAAGAATDTAGNASTTAATLIRTADVTRPSVVLDAPAGPRSAAFRVSVTFDEAVTGLLADDLVVDNGTASDLQGSGAAYSVLVTPTGPGTVTVRLPAGAASDAVGNTSTASTDLVRVFDPERPVVALDAPAGPVSGPFTVAITLSEPAGDLTAADLVVTGGTASAPTGSGTAYAVVVTPTADGPVTLTVVAGAVADAAGNTSLEVSLTRTADLGVPTATLTTSAADPTNAASVTVDVTFSEPVTGLDLADLTVTGGTLSGLTGSGASYAVTLTFDPAGDGATVGLPGGAAADAAGNPNAPASPLAIAYDGTAPVLTVTRGPGQPQPVRIGRVVFVVTASEPVSDLAVSDVVLGGSAGPRTAAVRRTGPSSYEVTVTGMTTRGSVVLSVAAGAVRDPAGNASRAAGPVSIGWAVPNPPHVGILFDNRCLGGGLVGTVGLRLTPDTPTTLTATSTDPSVVPTPSVVTTGRGDGDVRVLLTVRPRTGRSGTALVTITGTNASGTDRRTFRVIVGTDGADRIVGTPRPDLVFAKGGDDVVHGSGERDLVCGGAGDDRLYGGRGRDALHGQAGDDLLVGGRQRDTLVGGRGRDRVIGGPGRDVVTGGPGRDDVTPRVGRG